MSQHLAYITLESVVNDYLLESEQSVNKFYKIWHLGYRGFENLGIDAFYRIQSVKLPINANMTVTLPANYLNWSKVGVLNDRGEIIPLYYNEKLTTYADLLPDRIEKTEDNTLLAGNWGSATWCNYWNGYQYINIYGYPSGAPFVGSFKVDSVNGVMLLNENFRYDYLMLEYVANPEPTEGQDYYMPMQFKEALIAWITWKDSKAKTIKSHMQLGNNKELERQYYNERRNAIARWKPVRIYEIYQAHQEQSRMAIKT